MRQAGKADGIGDFTDVAPAVPQQCCSFAQADRSDEGRGWWQATVVHQALELTATDMHRPGQGFNIEIFVIEAVENDSFDAGGNVV